MVPCRTYKACPVHASLDANQTRLFVIDRVT